MRPPRPASGLVAIETHPIQYHAPVFRAVQQIHGIPVTVIYASDFSVAGYLDAGFGERFTWDVDLLSGYTPIFLEKVSTGGATSAESVSARGLRQKLHSLQPAAALIAGYSPAFHRRAILQTILQKIPVMFRGETNDLGHRPLAKRLVRDMGLTSIYRSFSRYLFVGQRSLEHFQRLGCRDERLIFSPYCVAATTFNPTETDRTRLRRRARAELGVTEDQIVLLYSGKLIERKRVDLLIRAQKILNRSDQNVVVVLLGSGELDGQLRHLATSSPATEVRFVGFKNQSELSPWFHAADLFVLPSDSEPWGLVVNEALLHGVPSVVSDRVGCAPDLIQEGKTGTTFESGSAEALAAAIDRAPSSSNPVVRQACRKLVDHYSVDEAAKGIALAFNQVIGSP